MHVWLVTFVVTTLQVPLAGPSQSNLSFTSHWHTERWCICAPTSSCIFRAIDFKSEQAVASSWPTSTIVLLIKMKSFVEEVNHGKPLIFTKKDYVHTYPEKGMRSRSFCSFNMHKYMWEWPVLIAWSSNSSIAVINDLKMLFDVNDKDSVGPPTSVSPIWADVNLLPALGCLTIVRKNTLCNILGLSVFLSV